MQILISESMPYKFSGAYVPEYVETAETQKKWLARHLPKAKLLGTVLNEMNNKVVEVFVVKAANEKLVIFSFIDGELLYVLEVLKLKVPSNFVYKLKKRALGEVSIWRNPKYRMLMDGFAKKVFWKWLVTTSRSAVSDNRHSNDGASFWVRRISQALRNKDKYAVYGLRCSLAGNTLLVENVDKIDSLEKIKFYYHEGMLEGRYWRLAIVRK